MFICEVCGTETFKPNYIYILKNPLFFNPRYVGVTIRPEIRLCEHSRESKLMTNTPKNDWIRKLQRSNLIPEMTIVELCCENCWSLRETYWYNYFIKCGYKMLNYAKTGGKPPIFYGEEHPMYGRRLIDFGIDRKGKNNPMYGKKGAWNGVKRDVETKSKISLTLKNKPSNYNITALTKFQIIEVDNLLKKGILSQTDIAKKFNVGKSLISSVKFRKQKCFKFLEEVKTISGDINGNN